MGQARLCERNNLLFVVGYFIFDVVIALSAHQYLFDLAVAYQSINNLA
jgi:hypothetical protein